MDWSALKEQHEENKQEKPAPQWNQVKNRIKIRGLFIVLLIVVFSLKAFPFLIEELISIFHAVLPFIFIWVVYKFFSKKLNEGFSSSTKRRDGKQ